jgi:hypothetical protein
MIEETKHPFINDIFESLLQNNNFIIQLLGQGSFGLVYGDSENQYIVKLSKHPIVENHHKTYFTYHLYFQKEIFHKTLMYKAYEKLKSNTNLTVSSLIYIDPGTYGECELILKKNNVDKIKRCWISMKRIVMCPNTDHKHKSRQLLYYGEITENMMNIIKAVAQIYAIHLVGAKLIIPNDLEISYWYR